MYPIWLKICRVFIVMSLFLEVVAVSAEETPEPTVDNLQYLVELQGIGGLELLATWHEPWHSPAACLGSLDHCAEVELQRSQGTLSRGEYSLEIFKIVPYAADGLRDWSKGFEIGIFCAEKDAQRNCQGFEIDLEDIVALWGAPVHSPYTERLLDTILGFQGQIPQPLKTLTVATEVGSQHLPHFRPRPPFDVGPYQEKEERGSTNIYFENAELKRETVSQRMNANLLPANALTSFKEEVLFKEVVKKKRRRHVVERIEEIRCEYYRPPSAEYNDEYASSDLGDLIGDYYDCQGTLVFR